MEATAFLADSVAAESGKIYAQGAGWSVLNTAAFPMTHDRIGIAIIVSVPYTATNQQHTLKLRFEDADGNGLPIGSVPPNEENDNGIVREIEAGFNVGRPPQLPPGAEQTVPFAININSVSFDSPGRYQFVVSIDGSDVATLTFTVVGQSTMGPVVR